MPGPRLLDNERTDNVKGTQRIGEPSDTASGSGVYGEAPAVDFPENYGPCNPIQPMAPASWHRSR
jgi:hypothetical protein